MGGEGRGDGETAAGRSERPASSDMDTEVLATPGVMARHRPWSTSQMPSKTLAGSSKQRQEAAGLGGEGFWFTGFPWK
jgi:CHASE1-domain containing sensor protein